jgi:pyruvate/2-oxoglutarate/acetoin dehydrogenase E1 component/TPP-dependent pyruvate/acetoin dehydrogenase alpha subunit
VAKAEKAVKRPIAGDPVPTDPRRSPSGIGGSVLQRGSGDRPSPPAVGRPGPAQQPVVAPKARRFPSSEAVLADYRLGYRSRKASVIGRREVLTGKAKFGIFGDGKEVAQLAMAKTFKEGDWRSGYYRDQTFMFATGLLTLREFFAQLYADSDVGAEPASAGRQMGSHFATRFLDEEGNFKPQTKMKNSSADISPTGGQMARLLGLAYASKLYRNNQELKKLSGDFSVNGNEVAFGTIGEASTSEGVFFETMNAAGVLQVPLVVSVYDDGYGISVPIEYQTTKSSISEALRGFQGDVRPGIDIHVVKGWDYPALCEVYLAAAEKARRQHVPTLIHVVELTQPQGHSTSGSHERYKSKERLAWEEEHDCLTRMRAWMISEGLITAEELDQFESEDRKAVEAERRASYNSYMEPIRREQAQALSLLDRLVTEDPSFSDLSEIAAELRGPVELNRKLVQSCLVRALLALRHRDSPAKKELGEFLAEYRRKNDERYNSYLYSGSKESPLHIREMKPVYSDSSEVVDGRVVLTRCFDYHFAKDPRLFVVGEDVGKLGDVNLVFEGLNAKYGDLRVTDTGIREATILGQGIGAAMRGLRPIVDIQYLDYLLYAVPGASDDLATLHWRTAGGQKAPVIIRTKGHRLEGIWHTGSPMAVVLHALRGIYVAVPRDTTRAAGLYNTLLAGDNPAILIEVLSGYRLKERVPDNVGTFTIPLGVPEILRQGADVTVVTYGACCRIGMQAAGALEDLDIDVEVIDVQTLNPFDINRSIVESLRKTNAVLFLDEDVPGGASAFMMQQVLDEHGGWEHLDAPPRTLTASENRSAYATDGDYFTKPSREDVMEAVYGLMQERNPSDYPPI